MKSGSKVVSVLDWCHSGAIGRGLRFLGKWGADRGDRK